MKLLGQAALLAMRQKNRIKFKLKFRRWVGSDCSIAYLQTSPVSKGPVIVFLHGLGASKDQWGPDIYAMSRLYRCIFVDLPGEGESSFDVSTNYAPERQMYRLTELFKELDIGQMVLIGSSIGGCIAALYAAEHPSQISKLILLAPAGLQGKKNSEVIERFRCTGSHPFGYRTIEEMRWFWSLVFNNPPAVPDFLAKALAAKGSQRFNHTDKIVQDFLASGLYPLQARLVSVKAQTLVVWGEKDRIFDVSCISEAKILLPSAGAVVIKGAGHVPYLERSSETLLEISNFIASA